MKIYLIKHGNTIEDIDKFDENDGTILSKEDHNSLMSYRAPQVNIVYASPSKICVDTAKEMFNNDYTEVVDNLRSKILGNSITRAEEVKEFRKRCIECFDIVMWDAILKNIEGIAFILNEDVIQTILDEYALPHLECYDNNIEYLTGYEGNINSIFWHGNKCICNILKYDGER